MIEIRATKKPKPRQLMNEKNVKIYAYLICSFIVIFTLGHWLRVLKRRSQFSSLALRRVPGASVLVQVVRKVRSALIRKLAGFPSGGHALLIVIFTAVNIAFCFQHVETNKVANFAARFGWMAVANMSLCVFLGLKNTPLGLLSGTSYERLNFLHRLAGYFAIAQMTLHAILYMVRYGLERRWHTLLEAGNWEGIVAGAAMVILLLGVARNYAYEAFYASHILGFFLAIAFTALHRPEWVDKVPVAMIFVGSIWALDRLIRVARLLCNLVNNTATIYPLPDNGVRIIVKKPLAGAVPGSHCFVWIPSIRAFQTHPFTIVRNTKDDGLELVLDSYSGFTRAVRDCALRDAGAPLRVSVDGPYGTFPDPQSYDKVILVAGGSGATFTFGLASSLLQKLAPDSSRQVDFIWAVRRRENLEWFADHIQHLSQHETGLNMILHVTRQNREEIQEKETLEQPPPLSSEPSFKTSPSKSVVKEDFQASLAVVNNSQTISAAMSQESVGDDVGAASIGDFCNIKHERLDVKRVLDQATEDSAPGQRVLVASCGPKSLVDIVQSSVAWQISSRDVSIDIHCENFGW
ncbi:Ferric/cupric reductase transmembrane component 2 [Colletotrichum trifolii]|uniref:ferric-chelate reductase (NADPH) n=1 Tax=Colletotrichum trifolii TaxID=5466 RepID=A0A4R8QPL5_COLTR|nr:Ferric/cupric reductase transmembrane component 2 [Colletotrichum trifolii]